MNSHSNLATLKQLIKIKYQKEHEGFARLMEKEGRLRTSLQQLDQQLAKSRRSENVEQQAIGADVLWQAWVGRKKGEINLQLAQVLALKERHISQVREAYAKVQITDALFETETEKAKKKMAQSQLDRTLSTLRP